MMGKLLNLLLWPSRALAAMIRKSQEPPAEKMAVKQTRPKLPVLAAHATPEKAEVLT